MTKTLRAFKFLFVGPFVLLLLLLLNVMTSPGHWWIKWPAFGIGVAWVISLLRVARALLVVGGVAAFLAFLRSRSQAPLNSPCGNLAAPER